MSRSKNKPPAQLPRSVVGWSELQRATKPGSESDLLAELSKRVFYSEKELQNIGELGEYCETLGEITALYAIVTRINPQRDQPGRNATAYERHKARMNAKSSEISRSGREIGPLPPVKDPERRQACEKNLKLGLETYWKKAFPRPWSGSQLIMIMRAELVILVSALFALAMPRGEGKTTICRHTIQWAVVNGHSRFGFLIGATDDKGEESLEVIKADFETNTILAEDFPEICYPIWKLDGIHQRAKGQLLDDQRTRMSFEQYRLILPTVAGSKASGSVIKSGGLLSSLRGANHRLADGTIIRPDLILLDDCQTRESAESVPQSATRIRIVTADILGMAGADGKLAALMPCTVIAPGDLADTVLDQEKHPEWQGMRTSMLLSFPERMDLWSTYWDIFVAELLARSARQQAKGNKTEDLWFVPPKATAYYKANRKEMDRGAAVDNPHRKRADEVSAIQHSLNWFLRDEAAFFSEFQNDPKDPHITEEFLTASEIARKVNGYCRGQVPLGVQWITFSIDCHERALTWMVCGFEPDFTGYIIDYGVFPEQVSPFWRIRRARPTLKEIYPKAGSEGALYQGIQFLGNRFLTATWKREDDTMMNADGGLIDQGFMASTIQRVLREQRWYNVLFAAFGKEIGPRMIPMNQYKRRPGERLGEEWLLKKGRGQARNLQFDTGHWKTFTHRRLATPLGEPGCLTIFGKEPKDKARKLPERAANHDFLSRHLDAEVRTVLMDGERAIDQWRLRPSSENHYLDNLVHCIVRASMLGAKTGGVEAVKRRTRSLSELANKRFNRRAA